MGLFCWNQQISKPKQRKPLSCPIQARNYFGLCWQWKWCDLFANILYRLIGALKWQSLDLTVVSRWVYQKVELSCKVWKRDNNGKQTLLNSCHRKAENYPWRFWFLKCSTQTFVSLSFSFKAFRVYILHALRPVKRFKLKPRFLSPRSLAFFSESRRHLTCYSLCRENVRFTSVSEPKFTRMLVLFGSHKKKTFISEALNAYNYTLLSRVQNRWPARLSALCDQALLIHTFN